MSRGLFVLVFGIFVLGLVSGVEEKVSVIILEDNVRQARGFSIATDDIEMEITHEFSSIDGFSANVAIKDLDALRAKFGNRVFIDDKKFSVTLDVSVPQIGGNDSWNLQSVGVNLSGVGQSVCILDTGVNYSHPALGGCYGNNSENSVCKVLGGYDYIGDDDDPIDDHGHGTHVAGIIASNDSTYRGVAPDSKIIAMKVLDSSGTSESSSDIIAAIDWCVSNASKFNISVISMSLGDNSTYNTHCVDAPWDIAINAAVAAGIPVVISSGNCDQAGQLNCTIGVAFPACLENVTRVGAVNDADVISLMRGALFQLMAPGLGIMSSVIGGGFGSKSGTSMSAPHVSGAIALIKQHLNLSSQTKTVDEIESVLNNSGISISDSGGSGYNFTRINVYDALLDLDNAVPNVTLVSPTDNHVNLSVNYTFVCNATDWQLANVTFNIWNSTGLYNSTTNNLTGTSNQTSFSLTNMSLGEYDWNCLTYDVENNLGSSSANFSLAVGGVEVNLNSPANDSSTNVNVIFFNCSATSDGSYELSNMTFNLWNSSSYLLKNETKNITGFDNTTVFNYTFENEDDYLWECVVYNNNSNMGDGINFSISYDVSSPVVSALGVSKTTSSAVVSWTTNENANSSIWVSGGSWTNSSSNVLEHLISVSSLSPSTSYSYVVNSCDEAGNCGNDSGSFTTNAATPSGGGGGGGGGSSTVSAVYIKSEDLWRGTSELLKVNDRVSFSLVSGSHSLRVEKVGVNYVRIVITSEPVYLNLSVGEEVKLNLSSSNYYDLLVKLNGIFNGEANVSVKRIFEVIVVEEKEDGLNESEEIDDGRVFHITEDEEERDLRYVVLTIVVVFILIIGFAFKRKKVKVKRTRKRKKKNGKSSKNTKYINQNNGKNKKVKAKAKRKR